MNQTTRTRGLRAGGRRLRSCFAAAAVAETGGTKAPGLAAVTYVYSRGRPKPNITCAMRRIWISSDPSVMR